MQVPESDIRRVFQVILWLKGAHGLLEVLGGLALAFVSHDLILRIVSAQTAAELLEDPRDLVANALRQVAEGCLKRYIGLRMMRLRGSKGATEQFQLAATAQNLRNRAKLMPVPAPA